MRNCNFVDFSLNISIERETDTGSQRAMDALYSLETTFRNKYGINIGDLLIFDYNKKLNAEQLNNRQSYSKDEKLIRAYRDPTIRGSHPVEVVYGTANIANFLFVNHLVNELMLQEGVPVEQAPNNAAHINVGLRVKGFSKEALSTAANSYMSIAGTLVGASMLTRSRANLDSEYFAPHNIRTNRSGVVYRGFYRTEKIYPTGILELRYPHNIIDSGYLSNQLILANKMSSDMLNIVGLNMPEFSIRSGHSKLKQLNYSIHNNERFIKWIGKNVLGINDDFVLEWYKNAVEKCKSTEGRR